jgi:hypothetical protein
MENLYAIAPHEIVYMYTQRLSDGAIQRRMLWNEYGIPHSATFQDKAAKEMGLDIPSGTILCVPWVMCESVMILALSESMGL